MSSHSRPACPLTALRCTGLALALLTYAGAAAAQSQDVGIKLTNTPDLGENDLADDRYMPGREVVYTLVVANRDASSVSNARVLAALPQGITAARWSCQGSGGARCGKNQGRGAIEDQPSLPAGTQVTYQFTLPVPQDYPRTHASLDVQARLQLASGMRALDPALLLAEDSDLAQTAVTTAPMPARSTVGTGALGGVGSTSGRNGPILRATTPFPSCGPQMYISQAPNGQTNTTLSEVDTSNIPFTLDELGTGSTPYNAIGFRPADNFIYGIQIGSNRLVRVHSDGTTQVLAPVAGLPATFPSPPQDNSYNAGEIGTDGYLYVKTQSDVSAIYRIDLTNPTAATATRINLTGGTVSGADFAWINGRLYTVNQNGRVAWINPSTGQVTTLPYVNGTLGNVGALFGTPTALYGSRNNPGGFYQFDLVTGQGTRLSGSPVVGSNDGAHCASAEVILNADVGVTKTNTPELGPNDQPNDFYKPGTNITYLMIVTNRGPVGVAGLRVRDALPDGISTANWTCQIAQGTGNCGASSGNGSIDTTLDLEFDEVSRTVSVAEFTLTISVPQDYPISHSELTNTISITLPSGYVDPTPGDNSATDTDPAAQADLRVIKSTPASSALVGQTIPYTLTVDNLGPVDVSNALLRDTAASHLNCLTPADPPTCTASGAATCPTGITRAALFGSGVIVPFLPANNGSIVVHVDCLVTQ